MRVVDDLTAVNKVTVVNKVTTINTIMAVDFELLSSLLQQPPLMVGEILLLQYKRWPSSTRKAVCHW